MEPNSKRRMPEAYDVHRAQAQDVMSVRALPAAMPSNPAHVNGQMNSQPRHVQAAAAVVAEQGAADVNHDGDIPRDRTEEWNGLVSMMTVIHAMVEKVYQAMCMLRETEQQDRQAWLAFTHRQRDEAEQAAAVQANRIINNAMGKAEEAIQQRRPYTPPAEPHPQPSHEPRPVAQPTTVAVAPHVVEPAPRSASAVAASLQPAAAAPAQDPHPQQPSDEEEVCWNCGREATETCSRCKRARYCGVWCQRRDWKMKHHRLCREPAADDVVAEVGSSTAEQQQQQQHMEERARAGAAVAAQQHAGAEERAAEAHADSQRAGGGVSVATDAGQQQQQQQQLPVVYVQDPSSA